MTVINERDVDKLYHIIGFLLHIEKDMIHSRDQKRLAKYLESLQKEVAKLYKKLGTNPPYPPEQQSLKAKRDGRRVAFSDTRQHLGNPELEASRKEFQRNNK